MQAIGQFRSDGKKLPLTMLLLYEFGRHVKKEVEFQ
jgi:hypothetical protein